MIKANLHSKNMALIMEVSIDAAYVPRVGEVINFHGNPNISNDYKDTLDFFVYEVTYTTENNVLIPELNCRQWWHGDRRIELEEQGWL